MEKMIDVDATDSAIWETQGAKEELIITLLSALKFHLKLDNVCEITLPKDNVINNSNNILKHLKELIFDFDDNFNVVTKDNIIEITRTNTTESYKPEAFQD